MHSKWQIWDFFQSYPKGSFLTLKGKVVLQGFDPLSLRLMKDHLLFQIIGEDRPKHIMGSDVTITWLEDEYRSLGLFGNSSCYIISAPDDMNSACKEFLLAEDLMLEGRSLTFSFQSDSQYLKKLLKTNVTHIQMEAPRFWEMDKLLDFLSRYFQLPLQYEAKKYLLSSVEHELISLFDAFRLIKLNYPQKKDISVEDIRPLIDVERLDQFALATELGRKQYAAFFEKLLSVSFDYDRLRGIFSFLQGHFLRVADPSYLEGKARLSQYDKEIQTLAKTWKRDELEALLFQLQEWEMDCKLKSSFLQTGLRQSYLCALKGTWKASARSSNF